MTALWVAGRALTPIRAPAPRRPRLDRAPGPGELRRRGGDAADRAVESHRAGLDEGRVQRGHVARTAGVKAIGVGRMSDGAEVILERGRRRRLPELTERLQG